MVYVPDYLRRDALASVLCVLPLATVPGMVAVVRVPSHLSGRDLEAWPIAVADAAESVGCRIDADGQMRAVGDGPHPDLLASLAFAATKPSGLPEWATRLTLSLSAGIGGSSAVDPAYGVATLAFMLAGSQPAPITMGWYATCGTCKGTGRVVGARRGGKRCPACDGAQSIDIDGQHMAYRMFAPLAVGGAS